MDLELVLGCVIPYIQDTDDLSSVSLVSTRCRDTDSFTRKHVTVHVHYLPDPKRLTLRFPNLDSLRLKSYSHKQFDALPPVTPWLHQIAKLDRLKSLSIRNMAISDSDLHLLATTRGPSLQSLEIRGCKLSSDHGLIHISTCCLDLRSLSLHNNHMEKQNGKWFLELSLRNSVMESFDFHASFPCFEGMEDVERLAMKCRNSLVSLNVYPQNLTSFTQVFKHAKKLHHFGIGVIREDEDYSDVKFPSNIRALHICDLREASFPYLLPSLLPYLNQLRELDIRPEHSKPSCLCFLVKRCPNLEVLVTLDKCGDEGLQVIAQFCKKLRKLSHLEWVTHLGLIALAQGCPNLTHLNVRLLDTSNEVLECLGTHLKNLRDFCIWMGTEDGITDSSLDNGVRAMLMGCSKLKKLDIGLSRGGLTDLGLGYIGRYGSNLRSLSLCITGESDVGLLELSKGCLKLRKLTLICCPFSEQAISTFVFNIHSLRYIRAANSYHPELLLTRPMLSAEDN